MSNRTILIVTIVTAVIGHAGGAVIAFMGYAKGVPLGWWLMMIFGFSFSSGAGIGLAWANWRIWR